MKKRKGFFKIINGAFDLSEITVKNQLKYLVVAVSIFFLTWVINSAFNITDEFIEIFNIDITLSFLIIILFLEIIFALGSYIYGTLFIQIDMLDKYLELKEYEKPTFRTVMIGISMPILFIMIIANVSNIGNFCFYAILYYSLDYIESSYYYRFICSRLILKVEKKEASSKGYITSVRYFLQQPQLLRRTLVIISFFSALSILLFFKNYKNNIDIENIVYGIVIITIAINEIFIYLGRRNRNKVLEKLNKKNSDKD